MIGCAVKRRMRAVNVWLAVGAFLLLADNALAACPTLDPTITHRLNISFCELCGIGEVTIRFSYPGNNNPDLTNLIITEDLGASGLTYIPGTTTFNVNNGPAPASIDPNVSGPNGSVLTWNLGNYVLPSAQGGGGNTQFLDITFQVRRADSVTQEGLVTANRTIVADISYQTINEPPSFPGACNDTRTSGSQTLPLREPLPQIIKRGRNVDANQTPGQYRNTVYGHNNDDIIWRIEIRNNGLAGMQDLRFDDLMQNTDNLLINYACPTEAAATAVANNNGIAPGGSPCIAASNTINNFIVTAPFGNGATSNFASPYTGLNGFEVDVTAGGRARIYLVGKITANGSCVGSRTNTVSDVQWGCGIQPPAGGITSPSTGGTPTAQATLITRFGDQAPTLSINRQLTGTNTSQPVGSKGTMTITITNNTGGTVKNIRLADVLPPEYVMDPTFTPTASMNPAFNPYPGMIDNITWDNPAPGTFPLTTTDPLVPLTNTNPAFTLTSQGCSIGPCAATVHPIYADQRDMMRRGDVLTIRFRVVLIRPASYDKVANLDVRTEVTSDGTDPTHVTTLTNTLTVDFDTLCGAQGPQSRTLTGNGTATNGSAIAANPEDLDVDIVGTELVFILTNDPNFPLPLTVALTNNGGHDAADYRTFVSFGATMEVVSAPSSCAVTSNPPPLAVWTQPASIPGNATIYECTGGPIAPGQTVSLNFEVIKSSDPARIAADDLTFRADVVGEITLSDGTPLWFPAPTPRPDGVTDRANNYTLDGIRARVIGFNLLKSQVGTCTENNPPPATPDDQVQIGEECTVHIETGGWFGFQTPGFTYIAVQRIQVVDELPDGQGYVSSSDPLAASTSAIQGVSLNNDLNLAPPPPAPLEEGWFNWTFNQVVPAQRISELDHWFRVDVTTRLLNDPIDVSAPPNQHAALSRNVLNSTFEAVFFNDITGLEEVFGLGQNTVGYPPQVVRRVDLTVTEPRLLVTKEVCNETLYGAGPACSNWTTLADDGDAFNSYIYRLTVTNEAASAGVTRAPAYDVVVTDVLDASDLAFVLSFASDGLNNDGDAGTDEAGAGAEGSINDNVVKNGTPAEITFSYTHSTALQRIDPGQSVQLYYRVDYDDDAAPLQTFTNTANTTYDSLTGPSGNQSAPQRPNSDIGGARVYQAQPTSAQVRIIPVLTQPKRITQLSNTPLGGSPQPASIGEEIEYELVTSIPVALLRSFIIRDELPVGIRCSEAPVINLNAPPYAAAGFIPGGTITPTCTDTLVEWNFGDQRVTQGTTNNRYDFAIRFIARVENTANTNEAGVISNGGAATNVTASYIDETNNLVTLTFGQVDIVVREPRIDLTKAFTVTNADAGDVLTVTVSATNTGSATAYNLRVLDDLTGRKLTFLGNLGGADPPDNIDTTTLGANQPIFSWNPANPQYAIAPGESRGFTFEVRVDTTAEPLEVLDNTLQASWTSLPSQNTALNSSGAIGADGSDNGLRNGALPNGGDAVNDYETTATHDFSVPAVTMSKTDLSPATVPTIGAHKNFQIEIRLPEGTANNVIATDNLAASGLSYVLSNNTDFDITYTFEGIATVNGQPPSEAALLAFPADNTSGSATWDIGTVVTQTENDPSESAINPVIRINYYARVNNDLVTDSGDTLQNGVVVNYRNGETGAQESLNDVTAPVLVVEPVLTVSKTLANVTPGKAAGDPAAGGDLLEFVITIPNGGDSTAHDVNIVDTLSPGLELYAGFTPTATIGGTPVAGFVATPANAPSGPLIWGQGNGDGSLDVPVGQSLVLSYRVVVLEVGGTLSNSALVDWTSLDGVSPYERTGAGCPAWTAPNDYCTGPAVATTPTVDDTAFAKAFVADTYDSAPLSTATDAIVRIGDTVTYRLALTLRGGLTRNVVVQDVLPAGMVFVDVVSINGDTAPDYTPPASGSGSNFAYAPIPAASVPVSGQTGTLSWTLGDIVNDPFGDPTTDTLEILYRASVQPDAGIPHVASTTLTNNATLNYLGAPSPLPGSALITVRQPIIGQITKIDRSGRTSPASVNVATDVMNFQVQACNTTGQAPAYSVLITDQLPTQLDETSIAGPVNGAGQPDVYINGALAAAGTGYTYTPPAARGGAISFLLITPVNPGECVVIDYDIGFYTDFGANQIWNNSATVGEYWSLPAQSGQRYGPVGPATFSMQNVATTEPPAKTIIAPASGEVTIGEEVVYRITVPGAPVNAALYDVAVTDVLDANLEYVGATEVSGNGFTLVDNSVLPSQVSLSISQIPAGQQAVIELRVRVRNIASAQEGVSFTNTALYTYAETPGGATLGGGSATTAAIRIIEPLLSAAKSVINVTNPGNPPQAGDILRYTLVFTAAGGAAGDDFADAFDLRIDDSLSLGLTYAGNPTVDGAGNTISAPTISGDGVTTAQTLVWSLEAGNADIDIVEGTVVNVSYEVLVLDSVLANQVLTNSVTAQWTGLDGASAYERNGTATPVYNDYFTAPVTTTLTVADNNTITKTRILDTFGAADANVRVGDILTYELRLGLQEGTHTNVRVTDILPQGLAFEGLVHINGDTAAPYTAVAPFTHADIAGPVVAGDPVTGPTTVSLNIGDIVNAADGNAANDAFVIVYRARVVNDVHPQLNAITLTNTASLDYDTATGPAPTRQDSEAVTLLQPNLTVSKSATPAGGDTVIVANELITYTVDITNTGTAPAYDVVLRDVIPVGLRNGAATITMVETYLVSSPPPPGLPNLAPAYDPATGVATWNFDTGVADVYTIPPGDTLRVVYQVQADSTIGTGLTLTNQAQVQLYYSFDDEAVPSDGGIVGVREIYGPSNVASTTLTTATPGALSKQNPATTTVAIGQPFTYRVTVPATPIGTALYDVRILDDLSASGADLSFVSVTKVFGSQPWTPVNTGTPTNLVIEDPVIGIDIPAGEQIIIDITVVLNDSPTNVSGLQFTNTATYTYNAIDGNPATQQPGAPDTTGPLTIAGPDAMEMVKSGPATLQVGTPGTFTLDVRNAGTGDAWNLTVTDRLPNPTPGGMCDTAPTILSVQILDALNNPVATLAAGSDYSAAFTPGTVDYLGQPTCDLTVSLLGTRVLPAGYHLIVSYQALLDADNLNGTTLTNVAGATQWQGADPAGGGTPRVYTRTLTNGTVGTLDHEDEHTLTVEAAVLVFHKTVVNATSGAATAAPGDTLRYTLRVENVSAVPLAGFSLVDDLDHLNTPPLFQAGSLQLIAPVPGTNLSNPVGGTNGTGLVDIRDLSLAASDGLPGGADELLVVYQVTLVPVIANGTVVLNQAQLLGTGPAFINSDDPNVNGPDDPDVLGDEDPTRIVVNSAPAFQVYKVSDDISGDPVTLVPGDTLRYTITVKNVGNENAVNVVLQDAIPANTTYVANSTTLNGTPVPDVGGVSPLQAGMLINAPEDPTPGAMRADPDPAANNVATIVFDVTINADVPDGTVISNQGFMNGSGAGGTAFPAQPSDDPATTAVNDPTLDTVVRPNGIVYDAVRRQPVAGVTLRLLRAATGTRVPDSCFNDPAQQDQVTAAGGYYKFDLNFSDPIECPPDDEYLIVVTVVPAGYDIAPSRLVPPSSSAATPPYSVPLCPADAIPATSNCEAQASDTVPAGAAPTVYYLHLTLGNTQVPQDSQIFNNHIPLDPELAAAIGITKTTPLFNVTRAGLVPYTITLKNTLGGTLQDLVVIDTLPPGFKYVEGSSRFDGQPLEPVNNGRQLRWENVDLAFNETHTLKLLLVVGSGVNEGEYVNQAQVISSVTGEPASGIATATVRVIPDPTFDCTDVIGKVFDDANLNGYQDQDEKGLGGVRVVSARGLLAKTDEYGRFHITCAVIPNETRGSNFILKLDDRTLPTGYRLTTENPLVRRATRGKAIKFNFGAALHRVVRLDVADGVFEPGSTEVRPQWKTRFEILLNELRKSPSILRISYLADVEDEGIVKARLRAMKGEVAKRWQELDCCYRLTIETEIFWRRGRPPPRKTVGGN